MKDEKMKYRGLLRFGIVVFALSVAEFIMQLFLIDYIFRPKLLDYFLDYLVTLFLIMLLWILTYVALKVLYLLKSIFSRNEQKFQVSIRRSLLVTTALLLLITILQIVVKVRNISMEREFERVLAQCRLEIIRSKIVEEDKEDYTDNCMKAKNYKYDRFRPACSFYLPELYQCYEH
jgi:hypothetical protein